MEQRCLVPVTIFAEPDPASKQEGGNVPNAWFAHDDEKSLMFFAGTMCRNGKVCGRSGTASRPTISMVF